MALIPYEPFKDIEKFFGGDDFFPERPVRAQLPQMDVFETEESIVAEVSAPGMNVDDLDVSLNENVLTVRGEKKEEVEDKEEERGYYRKEIRKGSFERSVRLPTGIDQEEIKATHENGILKIEIPKKKEEVKEGKRIEIESK